MILKTPAMEGFFKNNPDVKSGLFFLRSKLNVTSFPQSPGANSFLTKTLPYKSAIPIEERPGALRFSVNDTFKASEVGLGKTENWKKAWFSLVALGSFNLCFRKKRQISWSAIISRLVFAPGRPGQVWPPLITLYNSTELPGYLSWRFRQFRPTSWRGSFGGACRHLGFIFYFFISGFAERSASLSADPHRGDWQGCDVHSSIQSFFLNSYLW